MYARKYDPAPPVTLPEHYGGSKFRPDGTEAPIEPMAPDTQPISVSETISSSFNASKPHIPLSDDPKPDTEQKPFLQSQELFPDILSSDMLLLLLVFLLSGSENTDELPTVLLFLLLL